MARRRLAQSTIDIGNRRERRIHQDDARAQNGVKVIIDLRGVVAGDGPARKEEAQKVGASFREFVQRQAAASDLGEDGKKPGPGRRLKDVILRGDLRRRQCREPHGQRR